MVVEEVVEVVVVVALAAGHLRHRLPNVRMILYSPFHDFISRSIRSWPACAGCGGTRGWRRRRSASTVIPRSTADSSTIVLRRKVAGEPAQGGGGGRRGAGGARG